MLCTQLKYSDLLVPFVLPGTVSWGYLFLCVTCLFPYLLNETGGSLRPDAYLLFLCDLHRMWQRTVHNYSKGSFLSILFFSIFKNSKYWPSFTDPSASSRHPVKILACYNIIFSENSIKSAVGSPILQTKEWLRGTEKLAQGSGDQAPGLMFTLPCRLQGWSDFHLDREGP